MSAAMERELDTLRFRRGRTHFVRWIHEPWSAFDGSARTFCGRDGPANDVVPQKFSAVSDWCGVCYDARRKSIEREARTWPGDRLTAHDYDSITAGLRSELVHARTIERAEAVRAALDDLERAVEGLPLGAGSHWDSLWNDATGARDVFHECSTDGLTHAAVLRLITEARERVKE